MAHTLDQQNSDAVAGDFQLRRASNDNVYLAQKFTPTITANVSKIEIDPNKTGSPIGNIWVEIWSDNAGVPGTRIGGTTDFINVASLTASHDFLAFVWTGSGPLLVNGTSYWIIFNGDYTPSTTDTAQWGTNGNVSFINFYGYDGSAWIQKGGQAGRFKEYYDNASTTTSTSTTTTSTSTSTTTTSTSTSTSTTTTTSTSTTTTSTSTTTTSTSTTTTSTSTTTTSTSSSSSTSSSTSTSTTYPLGFAIDGDTNKQENLSFSITEEDKENTMFSIDEGDHGGF